MTKLLFFIIGLTMSLNSISQELNYKIMWGEKEVGFIKATKKQKKDTTQYLITADAKIKILLSYRIESFTDCNFKNGRIVKSYANYIVNKKTKEETTIKKTFNGYKCKECKEFDSSIKSIRFTTSKLYFHEPIKGGKVFSERFGEYILIKKIKDHVYSLTLPNGNENLYYYEKGKLVKIAIDRAFYSMDFILQK